MYSDRIMSSDFWRYADFRVVIDLTTESEVLQKLPGSMCPGIRVAMKIPAEVLYAMNVVACPVICTSEIVSVTRKVS
jgi:hypothetical protein